LVKQIIVYRTHNELGRAIWADDCECWLYRNAESVKHVTRVITDLREREPVLVNESLKRIVASGPRNADEVG